jgi:protein TonB
MSMTLIFIILSFYYICANAQVETTPTESSNELPKTELFVLVEEMPQFPGGENALMEYLKSNLKYPAGCVEKKIQGKTYVRFVVNEDGSTSNMEIIKSSNNRLLDEEAIRVVSLMPTWKPGKQQGKAVKVQYTLPINFSLK